MTEYLARFRADPAKIRIGVRRTGDVWTATIARRDTFEYAVAVGRTAVRALVLAFQHAEAVGLKGIDRWMQWAYDHPQGALAPANRVVTVPDQREDST